MLKPKKTYVSPIKVKNYHVTFTILTIRHERLVSRMSLFSGFKKNKNQKRRDEQCKAAKTFIQVHYVRERSSARYAFNTLSLKNDPEREACIQWYEAHNNPTSYSKIVGLYIDEKNINTGSLCTKAKFEPQYFEKLSLADSYRPGKGETIAVCMGLKLTLEETRALLKISGYSLTNSIETDLIVRYFIENQIYSIGDLNYCLQTITNVKLKDL